MSPEPDRVPRDKANDYTEAEAARRRAFARDHTGVELRDVGVYSVEPCMVAGNIENFTGVAQVPLGLAGPIRVNGEHAQGDFYVPLATTEGTLVASYSRGMRLLNACGGVKATVVEQFMQRAPVFLLPDAVAAREFGAWVWLYHAETGDYRAAWEAILADNPLPATMGRACYHTCETACNRARIDEAVGIHAIERFLGDLAIREGWSAPRPALSTGKRVLVVGAGPSGLSAAYHLARMGHAVTLRDAMPRAGGMMRYGIPRYRLPREIIDAEIQRIVELGVALELGARVDNIAEAMAGFDACFAAVGAHLAKRIEIPAPDASRILDAIGLLRGLEQGSDAPLVGRRVVVFGGGNTALDVARTARQIDAWLGDQRAAPIAKHAPASFERINPWYYSDAPRTHQPQLALARRQGTFEEVHGALDEQTALFEARRCLSCGNCFECDNCFGVCPDNAVVKLGPGQRFRIDLDFCKGCGLCAKECPCGAIDMVPEQI